MKLVSRDSEALVFRLTRREPDTLRMLLRLRNAFPRAPRSLSHDRGSALLDAATMELESALGEHRAAQVTLLDQLLADPARITPDAGGVRLRLSHSDVELLLQALNEVRIGAWEKLGCPESNPIEPLGAGEKHFLCYWALDLSAQFQEALLLALEPG